MSNKLALLIIEDEIQIRRFLRAAFSTEEYELYEAPTGKDGMIMATNYQPDAILLDLGLPDMDGQQVIQKLREWSSTPIIIISARDDEGEKIAALDAGADDYLTKPFGIGELVARLRVVMRRSNQVEGIDNTVFEIGALRIDLARRKVTLKGSEIRLTPLEFKLLIMLARHPGRVITRQQLMKSLWGLHYDDNGQNLRVTIHQLRQKLEPDPARPRYLVTEAGIGYRLRG